MARAAIRGDVALQLERREQERGHLLPVRPNLLLDTDYEDGSGSDAFRYDMAMHGPAAGVVFTF